MKVFLNGFSRMIFLLCLLVGVASIPLQSSFAQSETVIGSAENNGIKLIINNYTITNRGQEMVVYYTIQSKSRHQMDENAKGLMDNPVISIGDNLVPGNHTWHKKINNQTYQGAVKVNLPQYIPATSNVAFNTNAILHQKGEWTINFQIKK
ncbi:hypothetical protein [Heyndrickxia sporothermodurans]|uniref:hypothetical protein n=1 Tax=Heyndrickxia sporothermodurans TaxID=46224 RepID=UPI0035E04F7D